MKLITLFKACFLLFLLASHSLAFAKGVELCEPIKQLEVQDEIGGIPSKRLDEYIAALDEAATKEGWLTLESSIQNPPKNSCTRIAVVPTSTRFIYKNIFGHDPRKFFQALSIEKKNIIEFYKSEAAGDQRISISDEEYNRIAFLAAGVMGAESGGGKSGWFILEHIATNNRIFEQLAVCGKHRTLEACFSKPLTSRGMSQIKEVPKIGEPYGITRRNLRNKPYLIGVATVGFLIQEYRRFLNVVTEKKRYYMAPVQGSEKRTPTQIRKEQFEVFLTYIYRGDIREIYNSTATPDENCYYKRVQKHQEYMRFFVIPEQDCSAAGESILDNGE